MSLLKISLLVAFAGTVILLILSNSTQPKITEIKDITKSNLDNFVRIQGSIEKFDDKESIKIINVADETGNIDVIVFEENILSIGKGMQVEVIGKISEYQGNLQINAERIREMK